MDGNRRFANKISIDKKEGHLKGFEKLSETLQWCLDIGIQEVTVYAFSIENFKRSDDEVSALMSLAREKFQKLLSEKDKLHEKGIRIKVLGNINLLPKDIQKSIKKAMKLTQHNKVAVLNVAFAYTSRDELLNVIKNVAQNEEEKIDVDAQSVSSNLYTRESLCLDLLIRTSGEKRFSDFLLWQVSIF